MKESLKTECDEYGSEGPDEILCNLWVALYLSTAFALRSKGFA